MTPGDSDDAPMHGLNWNLESMCSITSVKTQLGPGPPLTHAGIYGGVTQHAVPYQDTHTLDEHLDRN